MRSRTAFIVIKVNSRKAHFEGLGANEVDTFLSTEKRGGNDHSKQYALRKNSFSSVDRMERLLYKRI